MAGKGTLLAACLLAWGLWGGCAKRTWEIGPKARSRPEPVSSKRGTPRKRKEPPRDNRRGGGRVSSQASFGPAKGLRRSGPGGLSSRQDAFLTEKASLLLTLPPFPWPGLKPPGWDEREEPWDPVAWFSEIRKSLAAYPKAWVLLREAALARAWKTGLAGAGKGVLCWKDLPLLPPLRGGKDFPERDRGEKGRKAALAGFLLRAGEKGPVFLVPSLFLLLEGRTPGPAQRVLLRFRKGDKVPPPFSAVLVWGEIRVEPAWSVDTLVAGFILRPSKVQFLP